MANTYRIKVLRIRGDAVDFEVRRLHPDVAVCPDTPGFGLSILIDPLLSAQSGFPPDGLRGCSPLAAVLERGELTRADCRPAAQRFVSSARVLKQVVPGNGDLPTARLRVQVTDPQWLAHLEKGVSWDGAAFEPQ